MHGHMVLRPSLKTQDMIMPSRIHIHSAYGNHYKGHNPSKKIFGPASAMSNFELTSSSLKAWIRLLSLQVSLKAFLFLAISIVHPHREQPVGTKTRSQKRPHGSTQHHVPFSKRDLHPSKFYPAWKSLLRHTINLIIMQTIRWRHKYSSTVCFEALARDKQLLWKQRSILQYDQLKRSCRKRC